MVEEEVDSFFDGGTDELSATADSDDYWSKRCAEGRGNKHHTLLAVSQTERGSAFLAASQWLRSKLAACSPSRQLTITKLLGGC